MSVYMYPWARSTLFEHINVCAENDFITLLIFCYYTSCQNVSFMIVVVRHKEQYFHFSYFNIFDSMAMESLGIF